MKMLVTRMLSYFSLTSLLLTGAGIVTWKNMQNEQTLLSSPTLLTFSTLIPQSNFRELQGYTALPSLREDFEAQELEWSQVAPNSKVEMVADVTEAKERYSVPVQFISTEKKVVLSPEKIPQVSLSAVTIEGFEWRRVSGSTAINTTDIAVVAKVEMAETKIESLASLFVEIKEEAVAVAAKTEVKKSVQIEDTVSTSMAQTTVAVIDEGPTFFEIPQKSAPEQKVTIQKQKVKDEYSSNGDMQTPAMDEVVLGSSLNTQQETLGEYPIQETKQKVQKMEPSYSVIKQVNPATIVQAAMTTQSHEALSSPKANPVTSQTMNTLAYSKTKSLLKSPSTSLVTLKALSVNNNVSTLKSYEVEAQDQSNDYWSDGGNGSIAISTLLSSSEGSRSVFLRARNHVTTHFDLFLQKGAFNLSVPVLSEDKLALIAGEISSAVPVGYVLVELDEKTDTVGIDGKQLKTIKLDSSFTETTKDDYNYILFVGVEVGNRTLSSRRMSGETVHKVIHIHEKEITFDSNYFTEAKKLSVELVQRDLLSKDAEQLIVNEQQVQNYFPQTFSHKVGLNTYMWKKLERPVGMRHYLSLGHQSDTVFAGTWEGKKLEIPTEDYTKEVIRRFKMTSNSKACIIQVNLAKIAKNYSVFSESFGEAQMTYSQVMDKDGRFYESLSENSRKLFIMGENQGGDRLGDNGKVNIKIDYVDGSSDFFSSFCSPQTYLVEQL